MAYNQTWLDCDLPLDKTFPLLKTRKMMASLCDVTKCLFSLNKKNKKQSQVRSFSWINTEFDIDIPDTGKSVT